MEYQGIEIGDWVYDGPKSFVMILMDAFGTPKYIEKNPTTNEAYSVVFKNIDGFDFVRIVDSNTNKLHPYPAKIYVEGGLYFKVPHEMVGALKESSPTIIIDELNGFVIGKCASLSICAATLQFVIDAVNRDAPPTRQEYDRRLKRIIDDGVLDPKISWWEDNLKEMGDEMKTFEDENLTITKDGHTDVASAMRQCRQILEEVNDIQQALPDDMEASLPSWWTNKLAVSSAYLNSLRDYIVYSNSETTTLSQKECEVEIKLDATEER